MNKNKQKFSFADVFIIWNDEEMTEPPKRRTIALKSHETLRAEKQQTGTRTTSKGSQPLNELEDDDIFYYCNNYEDFLELLTYGKNTEDFQIVSVIRLY